MSDSKLRINPSNCWLGKTWLMAFFALWVVSIASAQDVDSDADGLSDFHEKYKYLTNPNNPDTDGDGIKDGEGTERREYQYIVRSVVQVMKPVTIDYLNDDYQDARVLDETDEYVELEVIHYPFNRVASAIQSDDQWRETIKEPKRRLSSWLSSGPTSNWTPDLSKAIDEALKEDGIDLESLNDKQTVEQVSKWLLDRAAYQDGFSTFATAFDEQGKPFVPEDLKERVGKDSDLSVEEQWEIELSAAGMFRSKKRGSCSSSAIYLNGCIRAVGIPTRTILCIPIVDASDESEIEMIERLQHPTVRRDLLAAIKPLKNSWASHTFNEVYVGGRWRRLNYSRLGQNNYAPDMFGIMTHVATFHDWADAKMPETIGRRQASNNKNDVFGGTNPYSTISLRDEIGVHCKMEMPEPGTETFTVEQIHWTDSPNLPESIRENCKKRGRFGLIADVTGFSSQVALKNFLAQADLRVYLHVVKDESADETHLRQPQRLGVGFEPGCYWVSNGLLRIYVPFGPGDKRDLVPGVTYRFEPRNRQKDFQWKVDEEVTIKRRP